MKRSNIVLSSLLGVLAIAGGVVVAIQHKRSGQREPSPGPQSSPTPAPGSSEAQGSPAPHSEPQTSPPATASPIDSCPPSLVADTIIQRCESVIPSHIGSATWNKFAADYDVSQPGTSCGFLVSFALDGFLQTRRGTNQLRIAAEKAGVWHPASDGGLPCPGDAYALGADTNTGIVHVGIVKSATDTEWITLDSGQSKKPDQAALEVVRKYDPVARTLSSLAEGGVKPIAGWASVRGLAEKAA